MNKIELTPARSQIFNAVRFAAAPPAKVSKSDLKRYQLDRLLITDDCAIGTDGRRLHRAKFSNKPAGILPNGFYEILKYSQKLILLLQDEKPDISFPKYDDFWPKDLPNWFEFPAFRDCETIIFGLAQKGINVKQEFIADVCMEESGRVCFGEFNRPIEIITGYQDIVCCAVIMSSTPPKIEYITTKKD
jgi:hypothetical protein